MVRSCVRITWAERCLDGVARKKIGNTKKEVSVVVKEDKQEIGAREDEVFDRSVCRICYGDP